MKIIQTLTPATEKKLIAELERLKALGNAPDEVIEQSIYNGWAGFTELKYLTPYEMGDSSYDLDVCSKS